jgi:hypothetical protein
MESSTVGSWCLAVAEGGGAGALFSFCPVTCSSCDDDLCHGSESGYIHDNFCFSFFKLIQTS